MSKVSPARRDNRYAEELFSADEIACKWVIPGLKKTHTESLFAGY